MHLQSLDPRLLSRHQVTYPIVVVDEEVEEGSHDHIIGCGCIPVAVDAEVEVERYHGVMYDPAN